MIVMFSIPMAMTPLRIAFVCHEYPPGPHGGIGTVTRMLARALAQAGHQVRVVGIYDGRYPAPDYEDDGGVRVWRLRRGRGRLDWLAARYRLYQQIARWRRAGEIDLVEVPDWEGWAAGWPRCDVPVVVRLHGSVSYFCAEMGRRIPRSAFRLERASLRRAEAWCSVSRYTAERTQELFGLRTPADAILHNPVEVPDALPRLPRDRHRILFSGTLTAKKGIVSLIAAWPRVQRECRQAELHIFGKDGRTDAGKSLRDALWEQLPADVRPSVHFHGHVRREELLTALTTARGAIFPSYSEAFALAPMEAMAHGCPAISSRRGSGPELIADGQTGLLVDPDRTDEIASALLRILHDDALAQRLSEAGHQLVAREYSIPVAVSRNEAFYRRCLSAQRPAAPSVRAAAIS